MKKAVLFACCMCIVIATYAQTNILSTNALAEQILLGNYNPATYQATTVLNHPDTISKGILARVSADSLHAYLDKLRTFQNRNSGSDTVSNTKGIGAARRWIHSKFQHFSTQNENRLIPSYLQFDMNVCDMLQHRNIFAVLPGSDTADKSIVLIEAHVDSRCSGLCDTACLAEGMEDNGSGTALVMELARVMSKYSYNHTIVFMATMGEEQGLVGAKAFVDYVIQKGIKVKAVLNNDVVGGIICGKTASQPGCSGENSIDSTHVRFFSLGGFNSFHKQLSRYIKLQYKELIMPYATVPMGINIMTPEDRSGRGGDHIPFHQNGFTAMRFTSANEHGDANVGSVGYSDRQHTSADVLGIDKNNDTILDSFFVDFNYLARNTVINGNALGMAAISPKTPDFTLTNNGFNTLTVQITQETQYLKYRVGVRTTTNDWDSVYTFTGGTSYSIQTPIGGTYIVSVASVDTKNVESLFSREIMASLGVSKTQADNKGVQLLQNRPNPADEATMISVLVNSKMNYRDAYIAIRDIAGKEIKRMPIVLNEGVNEVQYEHGYHVSGTYIYTLMIDGKPIDSKRMVFAN